MCDKHRHILISWELGGGLGHISRLAAIAKGLVGRGWRVSLCLQDLSKAYEFFGDQPVSLFQAPVWQPRLRTDHAPACFSDILLHRGYGSAPGLFSLVSAWRSLFHSLQPDLLMFDYAPTALLAARDISLPKILLSSGFGELPPGQADVCLRPWQLHAREATIASEKLVVGVVNRVLKKGGSGPIRQISDIYQAERSFLFMVPELDLLKNWSQATYLRPPREAGAMPPAVWPEQAGKRIFAYLKPSSPLCLPTIESIFRLSCTGLIVCAGLPDRDVESFRRPGLRIYSRPCDLTEALDRADLVVCHAGRTTISDALLAGKPLMLIPEQLEQFHNALRVDKLGAGLLAPKEAGQEQIRETLSRLLTQPGYQQVSQAIATSNASLRRSDPVAGVVAACDELLAS